MTRPFNNRQRPKLKKSFLSQKNLIITFALVCIVLSGCQQQTTYVETAVDMQKAKSFSDSDNIKFSQLLSAGDSVAIASEYWPDAEILWSHSDPVKGKKC